MPCIAANDGGTLRCVLVRDMALKLEPGIYAVPGVDVADRHTLAAPEELAVPTRGGGSPCRAIGSIFLPTLEGAGLDLTWHACAYRLDCADRDLRARRGVTITDDTPRQSALISTAGVAFFIVGMSNNPCDKLIPKNGWSLAEC